MVTQHDLAFVVNLNLCYAAHTHTLKRTIKTANTRE